MKLANVIAGLEYDIQKQQKRISNLEKRRDNLQRLFAIFPNAHYEYGAICLDNIWEKITCMRLSRPTRHWYSATVSARFLLGKKDSIDDLKIYTLPLENAIANVTSNYIHGTKTRNKEITILDYPNLIPDSCPKKKQFLKRIKIYLVNIMVSDKMSLTKNSFNYDEFQRLMMLR